VPLVFGCITPHPPIMVPEIGAGGERRVSATLAAMDRLARELAGHQPDELWLISPHGIACPDAMGIATAAVCEGSLRQWGPRCAGLDYRFDNDVGAVSAIQQAAGEAGIPLHSIGDDRYELDHGVLVPLYFLTKALPSLPLVPLTFSWLPLTTHHEYGKALRRAADSLPQRIALIASGDLSHRLLPSAPAGYDPQGAVFDKKLVELVGARDGAGVLALDPELVERAGECGLRSITILLGALEGLDVTPQVLSYEGPFGVGYLVASFPTVAGADAATGAAGQAAASATPAVRRGSAPPLAHLAKLSVEHYVASGEVSEPVAAPPEMAPQAACFVSIHKLGDLRGCIGTFHPTQASLAAEVVHNAVSSATRDPRFPPVGADELADLDYSVDVLTEPEPVAGPEALDPRRYGAIVEAGWRKGLLLPDLEGVDTVEQQLDICRMKAGIGLREPVRLYRFEVQRHAAPCCGRLCQGCDVCPPLG